MNLPPGTRWARMVMEEAQKEQEMRTELPLSEMLSRVKAAISLAKQLQMSEVVFTLDRQRKPEGHYLRMFGRKGPVGLFQGCVKQAVGYQVSVKFLVSDMEAWVHNQED